MKILGIDIGYTNMGLVMALCHGHKIEIEYLKKIDLGEYKYSGKSSDAAVLISLFVEEYDHIFKEADVILVERQPPSGMNNIEALLHYIFMDKVVLISPLSVHRHFGMGGLNYEERKERSVKIARKYIEEIPYDREHDIADALCMIIHYNWKVSVHFFDSFRFKPHDRINATKSYLNQHPEGKSG